MVSKNKPRKKRRKCVLAKFGSEDAEQIALIDWAALNPEIHAYLICIPNQRKTSVWYGYKLKRMGVKSGVSDLFLARPNGIYGGLWIELKRIGGVLSNAQKNWIHMMTLMGYQAHIAYGWEQARDQILHYMRQKP